jgi:1-aminocyclopropane-1-carboxylate deaminase
MNLTKNFERYPLTFGPSPIEKLSRLSNHLGGNADIYAKRDDCNSGLAFGGNKIRNHIPEALAQGCDTLVTIGNVPAINA